MQPHFARLLWRLLLLALLPLPTRAALTLSTNFESASARILDLDATTQTIRISPAGNLDRGMPNWWFFRLDGLDTNKPLTLEVVALKVSVAEETGGKASPLNFGWTLPTRCAISTNGIAWQQSSPGERDGYSSTYHFTPASPTLWLAWGPPFAPQDAEAFVARMARAHPFVKPFTLGRSLEGRPVPALEIVDGPKPSAQRPAIWITSRQHAWEVGGTWVGIGIAEWLAGDSNEAKWLRKNADFYFVPIMDVDHVATGDGGKQARPHDHNRDWSDAPHWPEVTAVQKRIRALAAEGRMAVFLDLHNPSPGATLQTFYVQHPPYISADVAALQEKFLAQTRILFGEIKLNDGGPSKPEDIPVWHRISTPWVCEHSNPKTIAFTVETPWNIPAGTIEGYSTVGQNLGICISKYLQETSR